MPLNESRSTMRWMSVACTAIGIGLLMGAQAVQAATFTWDGGSAVNARWSNPTNWAGAKTAIPGSGDDVIFDSSSVKTAVVDQAFTIQSLTIAAGYTGTNTQNANLTVLNDFALSNGTWQFTAGTSAVLTVNSNMYVNSRILCPYISTSGNGVGRTFTVGGNLTVDASGKFDGDKMGFLPGGGPGSGGASRNGSGHGGRGGIIGGSSGSTYGSITNPVSLGSGAANYGTTYEPGGGAITLNVTGQVTFNGVISANGGSGGSNYNGGGAGGSVLIMADSISGSGVITANGGQGGAAGVSNGTGGGGGGRIAVILRSGAGFDGIAFQAYGGLAVSATYDKGAAGTIYLKRATDNYGRLIVDNSNQVSSVTTLIWTNVTDAVVGDVVIQNGGKLQIAAAPILTVYGGWSNGASFTADAGSTIFLAGTNEVTLYGNSTFQNFICTNGGKRLNFEAGKTNVVQNALTLNGAVNGSVTNGLVLRSTSTSGWYLNMAAGKPLNVRNVDVQYSNAKGGTAIEAYDSIDSGYNTNWVFGTAGQTNVWTGAISTNWGIAGNWSLARATLPTDIVIIPNGCSKYPTLDNIKTVIGLSMSNGASLRLAGYNLTISGDAALAGSFIPNGTETIAFGGNLDFTGGAFSQGTTRVVINGTNAQSVTSAGNSFYGLTVTNTSAAVTFTDNAGATYLLNAGGTVTFAGALTVGTFTNTGNLTFGNNLTANEFICAAGGRTLTFHPNSDYTIQRNLYLQGTSGNPLTLRSSTDGTQWRLNSSNLNAALYVDVKDSDARGGLTVYPVLSTNSGNNLNWNFTNTESWIVWNGASNALFTNAANWTPNGAPSLASLCLISGPYTNAPLISSPSVVSQLVVGGLWPVALTVTNSALLTVGGDMTVLPGGTVTHASNGSVESNKLNIVVGGNLGILYGGAINADKKGYVAGSGPGAFSGSQRNGPGHGGMGGNYNGGPGTTYGSITNPFTLGSGAGNFTPPYDPGGGAVRLNVTGQVVVNGFISANGGTGGSSWNSGAAGGSVLILADSITGSGMITANGGPGGTVGGTAGGGGGRITAILKSGNDFGSVGFQSYGGPGGLVSDDKGSAGSLYLKRATDSYGRLIVDNSNQVSSMTTLISTNVIDAVVGDVVIRNAGVLAVYANQYLTVYGSWSNGSGFAAGGGSTVEFAGTNPAAIFSSSVFCNFKSVTTGKRLTFEAGKTNSVTNSLVLLRTTIDSTVPGSYAYLRLSAGATQNVQRVTVRDNNATNGQTIIATKSVNQGHNVNWNIIAVPSGTLFILH